jgi:hypothetical protein
MAGIYDAFDYMNSDDYEQRLQKRSDNFVPLGSKKPKANIRMSPIVVPVAAEVKIAKPMPMPMPIPTHVSVKRAERPMTTTARKAIIQKTPIIIKQNYDYELNRPFSPIQVTTKRDDDDDWGSIYDKDFYGGKKQTRKARKTRRKRSHSLRSNRSNRSNRSKQTKRSSSRRYRGRKGR